MAVPAWKHQLVHVVANLGKAHPCRGTGCISPLLGVLTGRGATVPCILWKIVRQADGRGRGRLIWSQRLVSCDDRVLTAAAVAGQISCCVGKIGAQWGITDEWPACENRVDM